MLFLIFYNVFAVPVAIAFQLEVPPTHPWFWAELLFDVVFLIDVVLNFNTAVMTEHAGLSFSRRKIACEYLSFWFWIDFPSSIPLAQVFSLVSFAAHPTGNTGESSQILKTVKMIRLARILKLMRIMDFGCCGKTIGVRKNCCCEPLWVSWPYCCLFLCSILIQNGC